MKAVASFSDFIERCTEGTILNKILTVGLFFSYGMTFKWVIHDKIASIEFVCFLFAVQFINRKVSNFFERAAYWLQSNIFVGKHNENIFSQKKFKLGRFKSQGLQFCTHLMSVLLELPILVPEGWMGNFDKLWSPCPIEQEITHAVQITYMFELASYCFQAFEHRFSTVRNKDYYVMFAHHIATILLIAGSYAANCFRVGLVVMFIHDFSDIFVDMSLMSNQLGMEGSEYFFLNECLYVFMSSSWFLFRLVILPKLIKNVIFNGHKMCAKKFPGEIWNHPTCEGIPFFIPGLIMLCVLVLMHAYWFYLFVLIFVKIVTDSKSTNKGEAYEIDLNEAETMKKKEAEKEKKTQSEHKKDD